MMCHFHKIEAWLFGDIRLKQNNSCKKGRDSYGFVLIKICYFLFYLSERDCFGCRCFSCSSRLSNMDLLGAGATTKAPTTWVRANSVIWQTGTDKEIKYSLLLLFACCNLKKSIGFCYWMKTRAAFQAAGEAVIANLLDVSGSVCCVLCCLSLLTHHLSSCLLEAFQRLFLRPCQFLL